MTQRSLYLEKGVRLIGMIYIFTILNRKFTKVSRNATNILCNGSQQTQCKLKLLKCPDSSGGSRGARDFPHGPKFLHFHAVFGKNWSNSSWLPHPLGGWHLNLGNHGSVTGQLYFISSFHPVCFVSLRVSSDAASGTLRRLVLLFLPSHSMLRSFYQPGKTRPKKSLLTMIANLFVCFSPQTAQEYVEQKFAN